MSWLYLTDSPVKIAAEVPTIANTVQWRYCVASDQFRNKSRIIMVKIHKGRKIRILFMSMKTDMLEMQGFKAWNSPFRHVSQLGSKPAAVVTSVILTGNSWNKGAFYLRRTRPFTRYSSLVRLYRTNQGFDSL